MDSFTHDTLGQCLLHSGNVQQVCSPNVSFPGDFCFDHFSSTRPTTTTTTTTTTAGLPVVVGSYSLGCLDNVILAVMIMIVFTVALTFFCQKEKDRTPREERDRSQGSGREGNRPQDGPEEEAQEDQGSPRHRENEDLNGSDSNSGPSEPKSTEISHPDHSERPEDSQSPCLSPQSLDICDPITPSIAQAVMDILMDIQKHDQDREGMARNKAPSTATSVTPGKK